MPMAASFTRGSATKATGSSTADVVEPVTKTQAVVPEVVVVLNVVVVLVVVDDEGVSLPRLLVVLLDDVVFVKL